MATATQHKQIRIDGMTGDECCRKVQDALDNVDGVQVESVEVGTATISADNEQGIAAAREAIDSLGYSARQDTQSSKSESAAGSRDPSKNDTRNDARNEGKSATNSNPNSNPNSNQGKPHKASERSGASGSEVDPSRANRNDSRSNAQNSNQGASTGIGRAATEGVQESAQDDANGEGANEDAPTAEIDRGAAAAKKKVGDAGRDDRDRGDPMPERVKESRTESGARSEAAKEPRPANNDRNPTTNPGKAGAGNNPKR